MDLGKPYTLPNYKTQWGSKGLLPKLNVYKMHRLQ